MFGRRRREFVTKCKLCGRNCRSMGKPTLECHHNQGCKRKLNGEEKLDNDKRNGS